MHLWITGDSTTKNQAKDESLVSWGEVFHEKFDASSVTVINAAVSAYSIRDYVCMGEWEKLMGKVKENDVLLSSHGHLERAQLTKDVRGSRGSLRGDHNSCVVVDDPFYKRTFTVYSFGWYVRKYVSDCKARGVDLILLSPTIRAVWEAGKIRRGKSLEYVQCMRKIATETDVRFLDIGACLANEFNKLGVEAVSKFFECDTLHTNKAGANFVADVIFRSLLHQFPDLFCNSNEPRG